MKKANEAVDAVRRSEHKALLAEGDDRLKRTRYDWLRRGGPKKWHRKREFKQLLKSTLSTAHAWTLKEMLPKLWEYRSKTWAEKYFERWYELATTSGIAKMEELAVFLRQTAD